MLQQTHLLFSDHWINNFKIYKNFPVPHRTNSHALRSSRSFSDCSYWIFSTIISFQIDTTYQLPNPRWSLSALSLHSVIRISLLQNKVPIPLYHCDALSFITISMLFCALYVCMSTVVCMLCFPTRSILLYYSKLSLLFFLNLYLYFSEYDRLALQF